MSTAVFYASNTGVAGNVAKKIASKLSVSNVFDVKETSVKTMTDYDKLVIVVATHKVGEIQNDLAAQIDDFKALNLSGKTVAICGLGDAIKHKDTFNSAIGKVYDIVKACGAKIVGSVENKGYTYESSDAIRDGKFAGLPIDEANESNLTDGRIDAWLSSIKSDF